MTTMAKKVEDWWRWYESEALPQGTSPLAAVCKANKIDNSLPRVLLVASKAAGELAGDVGGSSLWALHHQPARGHVKTITMCLAALHDSGVRARLQPDGHVSVTTPDDSRAV